MFGYVMANVSELTQDEKDRYTGVYCGICRQIRSRSSNFARLGLSYDMAFLALLLMSLYEPEENGGDNACILHPIKKRAWFDNEYIRYAADMNVALAYYKALDDWNDDQSHKAKFAASLLRKELPAIEQQYPRQCEAISRCIDTLSQMESANCANPDEPAGCFGQLMAELMVYRDDMWAPALRGLGDSLGRFIYLADAAIDYRSDAKHGKYNPFLAMGTGEDWKRWENYLVMAMGRCTEYFERLPLVQDKKLLDNILYSGIWVELRRKQKAQGALKEETHD